MGSARAVHRPHPGISPEQARDARARAWRFVFQCWQESQMAAKRAPTPNGTAPTSATSECNKRRRLP